MFFDNEIMSTIVAQTNLYNTQNAGKCVNTNANEMYKNIGIHILMGIVKLPAYTLYWSNNLRYSLIADVMPLKRFDQLKRSLSENEKKTRRIKIRQYKPKKPKKWGFKNLVREGASGFMYNFYLYAGKDEPDPESGLQKCAQVVSRICKDLPPNVVHNAFFDNWFTTLELMHHLKKKGLLAVGILLLLLLTLYLFSVKLKIYNKIIKKDK